VIGKVSQTAPRLISSQESHVFQGVGPPAQFVLVPERMRRARTIPPPLLNSIAPQPLPLRG
jgi:hypothetical protein